MLISCEWFICHCFHFCLVFSLVLNFLPVSPVTYVNLLFLHGILYTQSVRRLLISLIMKCSLQHHPWWSTCVNHCSTSTHTDCYCASCSMTGLSVTHYFSSVSSTGCQSISVSSSRSPCLCTKSPPNDVCHTLPRPRHLLHVRPTVMTFAFSIDQCSHRLTDAYMHWFWTTHIHSELKTSGVVCYRLLHTITSNPAFC